MFTYCLSLKSNIELMEILSSFCKVISALFNIRESRLIDKSEGILFLLYLKNVTLSEKASTVSPPDFSINCRRVILSFNS